MGEKIFEKCKTAEEVLQQRNALTLIMEARATLYNLARTLEVGKAQKARETPTFDNADASGTLLIWPIGTHSPLEGN